MITFSNIPVWPKDFSSQYYKSYKQIIDNFERSCKNLDVLFLDNTYLSGPEVVKLIKPYNYSIIFNMVDPPFTWHYLQELLDDKKYILVGTDSPHIPTHFWLVHAYHQFPKYTETELLPKKMQVFLSYTGKPHQHRLNLINSITRRGLNGNGILSTPNLNWKDMSAGRLSIGLGDLNNWQSHFLHIVNETVFRMHPELIMSEKILKPLLGLRPFVVNGSPRYYEILQSWKIDIFDDIFPVTELMHPDCYLENSMNKNHEIICDIIQDLNKKNLDSLYQELLPRLRCNRERCKELIFAEYKKLCLDKILLPW